MRFWGLVLFLTLALSGYATASTTTYLRPNADRPPLSKWTVVGASTAWDALNDEVTQSETPNLSDYITVTSNQGNAEVDLTSASLAGTSISSATAWYYTSSATSVNATIRSSDQGNVIEHGSSSTTGWHSISLELNGTQSQLDTLYLQFKPGGGSSTRRVEAAFIQLALDTPPPTVYWGSWIDGEVYGRSNDAPWDSTTWNIFEVNAGKPVSIDHFGQPAPWNQGFSAEPLELIAARGALPLMDMGSNGASLAEIASGAKDTSLKNWATAAKNYGEPFFFRWDWEMNGTWFKWGEEAAANPSDYRKAWQHFRKIADTQGASNITWVWCPNTKFTGSTSLSSLYPGDDYVDWTCIDGYNRGTNPIGPGGWISFSSLFTPTYNELLSLAPSKPIMIGETASTESGGSKANWITDALSTRLPKDFPKIKAINWFNWNINEGAGHWDWQIESSNSAQAAFANVISSPYYATNTFGELPALTRIKPLP